MDRATLLAGVLHAERDGSNVVLLTRLGGGAFGNDDRWIDEAMLRALERTTHSGLDVRIVSRGQRSTALAAIQAAFS